jgi:hypothetical protein
MRVAGYLLFTVILSKAKNPCFCRVAQTMFAHHVLRLIGVQISSFCTPYACFQHSNSPRRLPYAAQASGVARGLKSCEIWGGM